MGMSLDRAMRVEKSLCSQLQNMLDTLERFYWSHGEYLKHKVEWMSGDSYKSAPRWVHSKLEGFEQARLALIWRHKVVFSYEYKGQRYAIDTAEYRKICPREICLNWSHTGAFIWRESPSKFFTEPSKDKQEKQTCQI